MALTGEQWDGIEALLPEVLELAPAERRRFLDRHCPPALRAELESLIAAAAGNGLLDRPVTVTAPEEAAPSLARGEVLGAWRIDGLLGAGGMGEVYAAERADGSYEQRVAIKLLRRGIDTQAVLSRFLRERRILARLSHPNIARLLDAGAAADGRPYLVMERIDGLPIDQWCRRRAPSLRQRLELMCVVCDAVYAAHREQIVHRDLKPSNVLVSEAGEVKLLDFGVSKLVGEEGGEETQTVLGAPLTPDYAAPEQLLGQPVTAATDVYALGLLLYRLLTGELPHARPNLAAAVTAAGKEDRIARPSATLRKQPPSAAKAGLTQARELDGDLDQIVLKALQREPARRYASAAELADDLRRHLDGRPVLARPDSHWYVARKIIVRNRLPVAAAAAVALALLIGLTAALWQARIARAQARRAEAQAQRAERVKNFVVSVFAEQDPFNRSAAQARTPQQILADATARLDQELGSEPELHAELLDDLGGLQAALGDLKGGQALLERAVKERGERYGAQSLEVAESLNKLARLLNAQGRSADAQQAAQRAVAILQSRHDADSLENARAESELATAMSFGNGSSPEAERLYGDAQSIFEKLRGVDDPETLRTLYNRASMHEQARQNDLAEAEINELILRTRRRYTEQSAAFGRTLLLQGRILGDAGEAQASIDALTRAAAVYRSLLGDRSTNLMTALLYLASDLFDLRRFEDCLSAYAQAASAAPDGDLAAQSNVLHGQGRVELVLGQVEQGERDLRTAYEARLKLAGENESFTWSLKSEWGRGLAAQGKFAQAEAVQREAITRNTQIMGPTAFRNALLMQALADTLELQKDRRAEAETLRRQALQIVEGKYPNTEPRWAEYAQELAHNLAGARTAAADAEGLALCAQVVSVYTRNPTDGEALAESQLEYAGFLDRAGRRDEARQQLAASLQAFQKTPHPDAGALKRAQDLQQRLGAA